MIKKYQFGAAVSLDIQNAFNSMPQAHIMNMLENAKLVVYLYSIIWDWMVLAQIASSTIRKAMTYVVP